MTFRLICSVAGGAIFGGVLGWVAGDTPIGIAICIVLGAAAAFFWERLEARKRHQGQ